MRSQAFGKPAKDILEKTACRAARTFAADFLVIEEGGDRRMGGLGNLKQGHQRGMTRGQIVELAVGEELAAHTPHRTWLGVACNEFCRDDFPGMLATVQIEKTLETLRAFTLVDCEQQIELVLSMHPQALFIDIAVHVDGQIRQPQDRKIHVQQARLHTLVGANVDTPGQAQIAIRECRKNRTAVDLDTETDETVRQVGGVRLQAQPR